jgi:predicted ATPase
MPSDQATAPLSSFIGRERELADVKRLIADSRLLTLPGPGGVGKTRLALELSRGLNNDAMFADGVRIVALAPLADAALVPQRTAAALGVREEPGRAIMETLQESLVPRRLLLVLDNSSTWWRPARIWPTASSARVRG